MHRSRRPNLGRVRFPAGEVVHIREIIDFARPHCLFLDVELVVGVPGGPVRGEFLNEIPPRTPDDGLDVGIYGGLVLV